MPHPLSAKDFKVDPKNTECLIKLGRKIKARDKEGRSSQGSWSPETMASQMGAPETAPSVPPAIALTERGALGPVLLHDHGHSGRKRLALGDLPAAVLNDTSPPYQALSMDQAQSLALPPQSDATRAWEGRHHCPHAPGLHTEVQRAQGSSLHTQADRPHRGPC